MPAFNTLYVLKCYYCGDTEQCIDEQDLQRAVRDLAGCADGPDDHRCVVTIDIHHSLCELTMTAGYNGPCTC
jgi:hypothetical protein